MDNKLDAEAVQTLSGDERQVLLRELVRADERHHPRPGTGWKWDLLLVVIIVCCIVLAAWIGYLAVSLPRFYRAGSWRGAWVGFDIAELVAFAATGWAAWKRRQILIICLVVLATLLFCDAWFDVVLNARTASFMASLLSALLVELPLAVLAVVVARRLLRITIGRVMRYEGEKVQMPPLWKIPLFGPEQGTPLHRLMKARATRKEAGRASGPPAGTDGSSPPG
jgi:hypothetical protein